MNKLIYIDGDIVEAKEAGVSADGLALFGGYGLFETMQAYNGKVFLLDEHLKRLDDGARALSINSPSLDRFINEKACGKISELLRANGLSEVEAYVKIVVTNGPDTNEASIIIFTKTVEREKNTGLREDGVKAILIDEPERYKPDIKNLNYMPNILARDEAKRQGGYDAIFKTDEDFILEGSATNIFIIKDKRIITPPLNGAILPGITREKVIKVAKADGITVITAPIKTSELISSDEAFLTNSIIEQAPLVKIDSHILGNGKPGELTKRIQTLYQLHRRGK